MFRCAVTLVLFLGITQPVLAKLNVVATLPSFGDLARQIGGDDVSVISLTKGTQDPHFVDAKPDLVLKLNKADLLLHAGLELEIGWLPVLVTGSRNSKILAGEPGSLDLSTVVEVKGVPKQKVDRSMGDVHPGGNPHYMVDPRNGLKVAQVIAARFKKLDPGHSKAFDERLDKFESAVTAKIKGWESALKPFAGTKIVPYHDSWLYFTEWARFNEAGFIEPKPGVPPSPQHVAALVSKMKSQKIGLVVAEVYYPHDTAELVAEQTHSKFLVLPSEVGGVPEAKDYVATIDAIVTRVTGALK